MSLIVDMSTLRARDDWGDFWAAIQAEMKACPRVSVSEAQLETLRLDIAGSEALCGETPNDPDQPTSKDDSSSEVAAFNPVGIIGPTIGVVVVLAAASPVAQPRTLSHPCP